MRFKQFLNEEGATYGKPYTEEQMDALKAPTPDSIEHAYKIGKTIFDNSNGLGAVPDGNNIVYMGFAMEMKPSTFLSIVTPADRTEDARKILEKMKANIPIGTPFLELKVSKEETWEHGDPGFFVKVTGHEGRARVRAFMNLNGDIPMFIHALPRGGWRARDFTPEFFVRLGQHGIIHQDEPVGSDGMLINIRRIFCNGKNV